MTPANSGYPRKRYSPVLLSIVPVALSTQGWLFFLLATGHPIMFTAELLSKALGHRDIFI